MESDLTHYRRTYFRSRARAASRRVQMVPCPMQPHALHVGCRQATEPDLTRLIERAAHHDVLAFGAFYDATSHQVFGMVSSVVKDQDRAEAIAEAVYVSAWRLARCFDASEVTPNAWLAAIVAIELTAPCPGRHPTRP